ncbi:MAG: type II secretion system protein M [Pseudomonadales bacterium]
MWASLQSRFLASGPGRWYAGREPGEQRVIAALALALALTIIWLGIWKPVSDWRATEHNRYQNAQAELDWLRANEARARAVAGSGAGGGGQRALLPVVTRTAEAQGISLNRFQPESSGAISVSVQAQPFNDLLRWLAQLEENNGVSVQRLTVDAEGRPGMVNAQVRLM